jgi:hypothetical protein
MPADLCTGSRTASGAPITLPMSKRNNQFQKANLALAMVGGSTVKAWADAHVVVDRTAHGSRPGVEVGRRPIFAPHVPQPLLVKVCDTVSMRPGDLRGHKGRLFACKPDCISPIIPLTLMHRLRSDSTNRMPQDCNSWGRGGPRSPGAPRPKSLVALDKKLSGSLQIFALIRSVAGRAGGVGPGVRGPTAGPDGPDPALRAGLRRAEFAGRIGSTRFPGDRRKNSLGFPKVMTRQCALPGR